MNTTEKSAFVYVTYIRTTPERLWAALTDPVFMRQYWFDMHIESDWKAGSDWHLRFADGRIADEGEILECDPPRRLVLRWQHRWRPELEAEGPARCEMEIEPIGEAVKLTIVHTMDRPRSTLIDSVGGGWPKILSNLKSLLETGRIAVDTTP